MMKKIHNNNQTIKLQEQKQKLFNQSQSSSPKIQIRLYEKIQQNHPYLHLHHQQNHKKQLNHNLHDKNQNSQSQFMIKNIEPVTISKTVNAGQKTIPDELLKEEQEHSNLSAQQEQFLNQYDTTSTIKSFTQDNFNSLNSNQSQHTHRNMLKIHVPNYTVYSQIQHQNDKQKQGENTDEKIIICKTELVSFAQCFAQEKIQMENTIRNLKESMQKLEEQLQKMNGENNLLREKIEKRDSQNSQKPKLQQKQLNQQIQQQHKDQHQSEQIFNSPCLAQNQQTTKQKIKQQFEKRMLAQKQYHNQKALTFELNKRVQYLQQKLRYQQQQIQRNRQLLKIKQDIIQNFQWEKEMAANLNTTRKGKDESSNKRIDKSINFNRTLNHEQTLNLSVMQKQQTVCQDENVQKLGSKNRKSILQLQLKSEKQPKINEKKFVQLNNKSKSNNPVNINSKSINNNNINGIKKYTISKKPEKPNVNDNNNNGSNSKSKINLSDSKKKLHVSLKKNSLLYMNDTLPQRQQQQHIGLKQQQVEKQKQNQKHRKSITLLNKKHSSTQSAWQLQGQNSQYFMKIINQLQSQNQYLREQLRNVTKNAINNVGVSMNNSNSNILKNSNKYQVCQQNQKKQLSLYQYKQQQLQQQLAKQKRASKMLREKCHLLQKQIQKTVQQYLEMEKKCHHLEKLLKKEYQEHDQQLQENIYQPQNSSLLQSKKNQPLQNLNDKILRSKNKFANIHIQPKIQYQSKINHKNQYDQQEQPPLYRPSLGINDLTTPQFRQSKLNAHFFGKKNTSNHFQNISLNYDLLPSKNQKSILLDTFEKQKQTPQSEIKNQNHSQSYLDIKNNNKISRNSLFHIEEKTHSNIFKGSIEDVSEIIYRNDEEEEEVLEETF